MILQLYRAKSDDWVNHLGEVTNPPYPLSPDQVLHILRPYIVEHGVLLVLTSRIDNVYYKDRGADASKIRFIPPVNLNVVNYHLNIVVPTGTLYIRIYDAIICSAHSTLQIVYLNRKKCPGRSVIPPPTACGGALVLYAHLSSAKR